MRWAALGAALLLAGCDSRGGWYTQMKCLERDLPSGLCIKAEYSCQIDNQILAYYNEGPRCYVRGAR